MYGNLRATKEKIISFLHQCQALPLQLQENNTIFTVAKKRLHLSEIQSAFSFCEFIVNSNDVASFHHTMAMKQSLEDDEIERQLNWIIMCVWLTLYV
jgi:hypothetical protein